MAIYINGKKVAGRGVSGKSPYQVAVSGGYAGTEAEFNAQLVAIGQASAGFQELSNQVNNAKSEIEEAVNSAEQATSSALTSINNAKTEINIAVNQAQTTINNLISSAETEINEKVENALAEIPDSENLVTKVYLAEQLENVTVDLTGYATETYVNNKVAEATASIVTDIWHYGDTAPENTKLLWIDSDSATGGLKYHNGSDWVHVPVAWQ